MSIVLLSLPEAVRLLEGFVGIYREAFSGPPYNRQEREVVEFARALPMHTERPGFRCAAAISPEDGSVVGFAYGYYSLPGQWWYDNVAAALGRERAREWLGDAFQLTELAVRPASQGQRLGSGLHDVLISSAPTDRAVLSTLDSPTRAWDLYRRRGWEQLLGDYHFPGVPRPYAILGRILPLNGRHP
jgi:ribosomal protein S18 acetylase RimI-like enzyme